MKKLLDHHKEFNQVFARIDVSIPILKDLDDDGFLLNTGALTLSLGGRNFVLDAENTNWNNDQKLGGVISFDAKLFVDFDTFEKDEENNYDLTIADLKSKKLVAEFYCSDCDAGIDDAFDFDNAQVDCVVIVNKKEYPIKVTLDF
jgi:hypothetical protein